jgi:nicotinamide phosphoribosyltransferase
MPEITPRAPLAYNPLLDTDSYKLSHWNQYPAGTTQMMSYFESRGGSYQECTLFGLQYLLHEYLSRPITSEQVDEAEQFAEAHGEPFNRAGWDHILEECGGRLPVRIRAVPEGTIVPTRNALMTVESTDPKAFWVVSWLETMLVRLWYPSTIATTSRESKKILSRYLDMSADAPEAEIGFKLHDFGARGVTSLEQSRLGGAAHLLSFLGSDTMEGIRLAAHHYDAGMAGFSIPASEHSTMTMWGEDGEKAAFENYVQQYLSKRIVPDGMPKLAACVSDSYDLFRAVEQGWCSPEIRKAIEASGGTLVIRPDSGEPVEVLTALFKLLESKVGMTLNTKGFKVLPPYFRVIQGDGIDQAMMLRILAELTARKISASNIAFGSGGGLLQKVNRDTQKWAFKCCAAEVGGQWVDVRKNPVTDRGKMSKGGRLDLIRTPAGYETVVLEPGQLAHTDSAMETVYENGRILRHTTFDECRSRIALPKGEVRHAA